MVRTTYQAMSEALKRPAVQQTFQQQGAQPRGWSPEQTGKFVKAEAEKWRQVIKRAHVTIE